MAESNNPIFVDSNYFISLANADDSLYSEALNIGEKLDRDNIQVVISHLIFIETVTVLSQRVGRETARRVGNELRTDPNVRIRYIDHELHDESWRIFCEVEQKDISFVDCSTIAVMQSEDIDTLLTFDDDFRKLKKYFRFSLWGGKK